MEWLWLWLLDDASLLEYTASPPGNPLVRVELSSYHVDTKRLGPFEAARVAVPCRRG